MPHGPSCSTSPSQSFTLSSSQACCEAEFCQAWVFAVTPGPYLDCLKQGDKCCWLKSKALPASPSNVPLIASGTVSGHAPSPPPPGPEPPAPAPPRTAVYSTLVYVYEWPNVAVTPETTPHDSHQKAVGGVADAFRTLAGMRAKGLTEREEARLVDAVLSQRHPELVALLAVATDAARGLTHVRRWLAQQAQ